MSTRRVWEPSVSQSVRPDGEEAPRQTQLRSDVSKHMKVEGGPTRAAGAQYCSDRGISRNAESLMGGCWHAGPQFSWRVLACLEKKEGRLATRAYENVRPYTGARALEI